MPNAIFEDFDGLIKSVLTGDQDSAWKYFGSIQLILELDPRLSNHESEALTYIDYNLAEAFKQKSPHIISPRITGLRHSIERRTTGIDGFPLRK